MPHKNQDQDSIFFKPQNPRLAEAISIKTPTAARRSIKRVKQLTGFTEQQKTSALTLAANRAQAQLKRQNLSPREQREMRKVEKILRQGAQQNLTNEQEEALGITPRDSFDIDDPLKAMGL